MNLATLYADKSKAPISVFDYWQRSDALYSINGILLFLTTTAFVIWSCDVFFKAYANSNCYNNESGQINFPGAITAIAHAWIQVAVFSMVVLIFILAFGFKCVAVSSFLCCPMAWSRCQRRKAVCH